ncbi:MAG: amphi-Trp domain-containing protein [Nannocystaceae bacterium]
MSKKDVRFEGALTREQAIGLLDQLTAALRSGAVRISVGDRAVSIAPSDVLGIELEVSQRRGKSKLELELTWREALTAKASGDLVIETAPPVAEAEDDEASEDEESEDEEEAEDDEEEAEEAEEEAEGEEAEEAPKPKKKKKKAAKRGTRKRSS